MFPGLRSVLLYYADPAQHLAGAGEELDDLADVDDDSSVDYLSKVCEVL